MPRHLVVQARSSLVKIALHARHIVLAKINAVVSLLTKVTRARLVKARVCLLLLISYRWTNGYMVFIVERLAAKKAAEKAAAAKAAAEKAAAEKAAAEKAAAKAAAKKAAAEKAAAEKAAAEKAAAEKENKK